MCAAVRSPGDKHWQGGTTLGDDDLGDPAYPDQRASERGGEGGGGGKKERGREDVTIKRAERELVGRNRDASERERAE